MFNDTCDRPLLHKPGATQAHGLLLGIVLPDWRISQVSANTQTRLGIDPETLLGQSLNTLLSESDITAIADDLSKRPGQIHSLSLTWLTPLGEQTFNTIFHPLEDTYLILELEPDSAEKTFSLPQFYQTYKYVLHQLQQAVTLSELCQIIVQQIQQITGFDRVMIYQFDETGAGSVIAENKRDDLDPYLGLHYPDSDIPQEAKALFARNPLRLIPDVDYQPVPLMALADDPQSPLDLSLSVLRSVSPDHIEYLQNMGVKATQTISLLKDGKLWGLISCHHQSPYFIPYEQRSLCEFLGQVMSLEIASKEANEDLDYQKFLKSVQTQLVKKLGQAESLTQALFQSRQELLPLVGADGCAIYTEGTIFLVGQTPTESEVQDLIEWLEERFENHLFVTHALPHLYPVAIAFKNVASGLLALSLTQVQKNYVLWFRPEQIQQVNWAGASQNPSQAEADGTIRYFPRKSFELWQETVRLQSLPWKPWEIEGAKELRSAIIGIVLQKLNELAEINIELERSNNELDAFAYIASHDLKEPLRGIHNYANFLLEDYMNLLDEEGVDKLHTLIKLTKRMEDLINALLHFSRLGRQELNLQILDLNQSLQTIVDVFKASKGGEMMEIRVPRPLPLVLGDRVLLEEVLTNLINNALKYNKNSNKWVEIGFLETSVQPPTHPTQGTNSTLTLYVKDNGIGIQERHLDTIFRIFKRLHAQSKYGGGTGVGLTIVKKIIERHHGSIWVESTYGDGSTFYFTLPQGETDS